MKDLHNHIEVVQATAPAVLSATATSDPIALQGFHSAEVIINTGAIVSLGAFTPKLQESDTDETGDFTDVAAADLLGAFPAQLAAASIYRVGYRGGKPYVRTVLTKTGGTSIAAGVAVVKGHPDLGPVA